MNPTHNTPVVVENNEHPTATKIGKIIGRVAVPVALVTGVVYVVIKTKNA